MTKTISAILLLLLAAAVSNAQGHTVKITGQMKDVMWKGQLQGRLHLDTLSNKTHLYGFGPAEFLAGEILVLDGRSYLSTVVSDTAMKVEESFDIKAPFFAHANIPAWKAASLPDTIRTIEQLEAYLVKITGSSQAPFMFKLSGVVEEAVIHIVNLPKGTAVHSPGDAHKGRVNYPLKDASVTIIGFFSTRHQSIFTHHDSFLHMHLITTDKQKMGHLDEALFKKGTMKLYLPAE